MTNGGILIVCLYINDLIFIRNNPSKFEDFKKAMIKEFKMTDIWLMKQMEDVIFIFQEGVPKGDGWEVFENGCEL